jgi:hypothetical protein
MSDIQLRDLQRRASRGDLQAEVQVGVMLHRQGGLPEALEWLEGAWSRGNRGAGQALVEVFGALPSQAQRRHVETLCQLADRDLEAATALLHGWFPALLRFEGSQEAVRTTRRFVCGQADVNQPVRLFGFGAPSHQVARAIHQVRGRDGFLSLASVMAPERMGARIESILGRTTWGTLFVHGLSPIDAHQIAPGLLELCHRAGVDLILGVSAPLPPPPGGISVAGALSLALEDVELPGDSLTLPELEARDCPPQLLPALLHDLLVEAGAERTHVLDADSLASLTLRGPCRLRQLYSVADRAFVVHRTEGLELAHAVQQAVGWLVC